jgi:hypothetical protein
MDNSNPKQITVPNGPHKDDLLITIGITPTAAAEEVKKIGRILRSAESFAASKTDLPSCNP